AAPAPSPNLTAYDAHGHRLPSDPRLRGGETVLLVVTGFAASVTVQVRLAGSETAQYDVADGSGTVHDIYVVPAALPNAAYVLTFVGPGPQDPATMTGLPHATVSNDDGVIVTVPNGGFFAFHIGPRRPTGPPSPTASVAGESTSRAGGLPNTGEDVLTPLFVGLIALAAGVGAVALGLRQRGGRREPGR
ncbi:MAG TPA: LPXTG cell wall anchor domain-containing protein, partial [Jatrophihabitantaceae bacterium]|nr:LPXTG cell wall anchor domain-containing protein [Jatrophihabitantaceae bacterium]